ncbi:hypothetical protein Q31a_23600 [Aureliella helgolandensis]|uniref:Secreted protein n=1 Tax=Aureliella helgolandensis TaxID=2527968 RepID=A0A518G630_9BACT|nr:hypothetical protein Q31a_23600 [Aureliella helgolandensis]
MLHLLKLALQCAFPPLLASLGALCPESLADSGRYASHSCYIFRIFSKAPSRQGLPPQLAQKLLPE